MQEHRNSLQPGYRLHWYVIKRILGQGGFGITYLADDTNLHQEVAIKEYLPIELAVREQDDSIHPVSGEYGEQFSWGLDRFMIEAQTLAQFKHPNIVRVLAVFPENNTAYMVMEYEQGQAMHELLKERKTLKESELNNIFLPILDGLERVHSAGFIHRDIKPPNIFIRADGTPVLLDFGSARQSLGELTRTLTSMVSPGYAPFEQYVSKSDKQGPWTDIYGLAATLYRSVIGRSPAEAMDRSEALLNTGRDSFVGAFEINPEGYSSALLMAIDHALAFKSEDRPQSISQWRAELTQPPTAPQSTEAETIQVQSPSLVRAQNSSNQPTANITIKTDETAGPGSESTVKEKSLAWYRKPLKVIAVVFGIFLLLVILDDKNKQDEGDNSESSAEKVETQQAEVRDEIDKYIDFPMPDKRDSLNTTLASDDPASVNVLLRGAENDIKALRLTSPEGNNAVDKYRQALKREPDNATAQMGMSNVAGKYLELAEKSLHKGDAQKAANYVDKAASVDGAHPGIPILGIAIANYPTSDWKQDDFIDDFSLPDPEDIISSRDRKKLARLKRVLTRNPGNQQARQELRNITSKYETQVRQAFREKDYDLAAAYVEAMLELSPDNRKLLELQDTIMEMQATEDYRY